ncbi:hypothetical protein BDR22DRAFT_839591 [Usnea florida]
MEPSITQFSKTDSAPTAPSLEQLPKTEPHTFKTPIKNINEGQDVSAFLVSKAYGDIMTFLLQLNRAMFPSLIQLSPKPHKPIQTWDLGLELGGPALHCSEAVQRLQILLRKLDQIIDEIPPDPGPRRFGNSSFRKWYQTVEERTADFLSSHLPHSILHFPHESGITSDVELSSYFLGSFGSSQRLDYGSGHELSFLAFLGCIWKLGGFSSHSEQHPPGNEERAVVLGLIVPYLSLIRRLILTYTLEPAGSHGVWGLDDHSFIPYIFGSAQYGPAIAPADQTPIEGSLPDAPDPSDVAKISAVEERRHQNMYFGAIGFIHDVKKGPFWEHSPMLYDISGIRTGWGKINKGMIKMYNAEVLSKFPVVQHFRFGSLFSFDPDPDATPPPTSVHAAHQPVREGLNSSSAEKIAAPRGPPHSGTSAPWASQTTSMPGNLPPKPSPLVGTAAPWATGPRIMLDPGRSESTAAPVSSKGTPPTVSESGTLAPWAGKHPAVTVAASTPTSAAAPPSGSSPPPARTGRPSASSGEGSTAAAAQSMPPPTRAPWAKPL